MMTAYEKAVAAQAEAANPRFTRMVSANAGSGKTRVLVDRVSRILLQGVEPQHILCLTYTKAAATEMQDRLYDKLGNWSILEESALRKELNNLLGEDFNDIASARRLFAKALETPEGLKVQTIHAFCERVLSRFPIEAGIMPGFEPIEDTEIARLSAEVRAQILQLAMDDPKSALNQALQTLTVKMADQTLDGLFKWMAHAGEKVAKWEASGGIEGLAACLGLDDSDTPSKIIKELWKRAPKNKLVHAKDGMLLSGKPNDMERGSLIQKALNSDNEDIAAEFYRQAVITKDGGLSSQICSSASGDVALSIFGKYNKKDTPEMSRIEGVFERFKSAQILSLTHAIFTLARPYAEIYAKAKRDRRGLDFNDQILLVKNLLNKKAVSDWVRYKLDGGIEHILLDEAQDTSPEQWEIINSLSEAFLQDSPDRDPNKPRTLFAVGDEKQSIYGFQGAKPEQFLTEIQSRLVGEAKQVRMSMSFRSSQTILNVVDCFLNEQGGQRAMFDAEVFPPASDIEPHAAHRNDEGLVELWPLSLKPEKGEDKAPWDTTPVDALGDGDEREVLARELALKIKDWLKNGEAIFDRELGRERAMQPGDILILVRTRGGRNSSLYDAIIRHLKRQSIPLAGADRIKLTDAMIVRDLLSLSRWVLLPSDDLSLAEVLKGPIFGLDDMQLLELAKGRGQQSLWSAVRGRDPKLSEKLQELIYLSQAHAPYEFYSAVLDVLDERQESNRKKFYRRLGLEAREALEVFLNRAMDHQSKGVPNLQYFIRSFQDDDAEVKRDMDAAKDQVRVMTVHGAKGLEAPVVILPDTTQVPIFKEALIPIEEGYFLKPPDKLLPEALAPFVENGKQRQNQEQLRLLYVALTRVESRLIICGHQVGSEQNPAKENSWYDWMQRVFESLPTTKISTPFGDGQCFGKMPALADSQLSPLDEIVSLPDWALRSAPDELSLTQRLNPSNLLSDDEQGADTDRVGNGLTPKNRGIIIHQLLEVLPNLKSAQRQKKASSILQADTEISQEQQAEILNEVFGVLENPEFSFLWEEGSLAEVNLGGRISQFSASHDFAAQIDRLCIQTDKITIVDFKSNRIVPETEEEVDDIYWGQMAAYRSLVQGVYPDKAVECALLWTTAPKLMWLSSQKLDHALTQIDSLLT